MIALDTNVLARFFVDDPDDAEAAKQLETAAACLGAGLSGLPSP